MISTISIGAITIGTYSSGYILKALSGFDYPTARVDVFDRGLYHGATIGNYAYGRRVFVIEGQIVGSSVQDHGEKRRAFERAFTLFNGTQRMVINATSGFSVYANVIVESQPVINYVVVSGIISDFMVTLVSAYPYFRATTTTSVSLDVFSGGGATIPSTIPMSLAVGGTGTATITNNGNGYAYPTITIVGPCTNPSVANSTTGESIGITYTLASSTDNIVVDTYNKTAVVNGTTNIANLVSGTYLTIAPGTNELKLTVSSGTGTLGTVVYEDTYLGL